ncbi:MAG TPA: DUF3298 domain-containing protein [Clostridiales bacterium]|nr:DUF3298 domain-containing protein [Clostridiales bacterium]
MKKRKTILLSILLLLLLIIVVAAILISLHYRKAADTSTGQDGSTAISPSSIPETSVSPLPSDVPGKVAELYPAPRAVDNEIKYGYLDASGNFVLEPVFDSASNFYDGAAIVTIDSKYCVINEKGNIIFINDNTVSDYRNGLAVFAKFDSSGNISYGYLDTQGNIVIQPQFILASNFNSDGKAYISKGSGVYGLVDKTGAIIESYDLGSKYIYASGIEDGYLVYTSSDTNGQGVLQGVVNMKGEEIFPPKYGEIIYLGDDLFAMKEPSPDFQVTGTDAKQAIFNAKGQQLSDYVYYDLGTYYNGYSTATNDQSTFFVGTDGKIVADLPKFEGRGTVRLFGDIISASIDGDQAYYNRDKAVIWKADNTLQLSDQIKVVQVKYKPLRDVLVKYPQIEGLANPGVQEQINKKLTSIFTDYRRTITAQDMISVSDDYSARLMKNLLIIEQTGYDYYYGAAHGMPIKNYFFIDTNTGVFYELKDLFIEGSDYAVKINEMINNEITLALKSGESMFFEGSFQGITDTQYFRLEEDAVIIYFYPYDISAYAGGFPEFVIPFEDVAEYLNREGDFWKAFH